MYKYNYNPGKIKFKEYRVFCTTGSFIATFWKLKSQNDCVKSCQQYMNISCRQFLQKLSKIFCLCEYAWSLNEVYVYDFKQ